MPEAEAARAVARPPPAASTAKAVIEAQQLSLTFETADGPVHALSGIDLTINKGDFVSLIGPSGCGKTTLLRVIADLEQPTGGDMRVLGSPPEVARQQRLFGYVFQAPALYPWRTVERNVMLPLEIMGMPRAERAARAERYLAMVNLAGFARISIHKHLCYGAVDQLALFGVQTLQNPVSDQCRAKPKCGAHLGDESA